VGSETAIEAGHAVERDAAILMLEIRGFTRFATTVPPKDVVQMLTSFHARGLPLIRKYGGVVDKFLGDGVMATFGAVEASQTAAADALRALEAILAEAQDWQNSLVGKGVGAALAVNGGVAAGPVVFATLGSGDRLEYTVIGKAVNLAAKLEKHNKAEGTRALVAAETYERAVIQGYTPQETHVRRPAARVAGVAEPVDLVVFAR
jgi:adenylate cyclase